MVSLFSRTRAETHRKSSCTLKGDLVTDELSFLPSYTVQGLHMPVLERKDWLLFHLTVYSDCEVLFHKTRTGLSYTLYRNYLFVY